MGSVVPGWGQARGTVCFCLRLEGTEPQSFTGSLWELRRLLVAADSWVPETRSSWMLGLPLSPPPPPAQPQDPHPCPRPPTLASTLGGRPAPLRVAPLTSRRGWGGAGPAPGSAAAAGRGSALRPPAAQGTPGPGRPLPSPPAAQTPGCAPTPGQSPSLLKGPPGPPLLSIRLSSEGSRGGPFLPLLAPGSSRRPRARGRIAHSLPSSSRSASPKEPHSNHQLL